MSDGDTLFEIDRELDSLLDENQERPKKMAPHRPNCWKGSGSSVMRKAKK